MSCQKGKYLNAIGEFHLAGVTYGDKDIIHVPDWERRPRGSFLGILEEICIELYGPGYEGKLKFEESDGHGDTATPSGDDKTDDSA